MFKDKKFKNIYIVGDHSYWISFKENYNPLEDLIVTFDFALFHEISKIGGNVRYIEQLVSPELMETENKIIYKYFHVWHRDEKGNDYFNYKNLDFGFVFRLDIWNDFTYSIRLFLNLKELFKCNYEAVYLGSEDTVLESVLDHIGISVQRVHRSSKNKDFFYFPMSRWMDEAIRPNNLKSIIRNKAYFILPWLLFFFHRLNFFSKKKDLVFLQNYHPTKSIISRLKRDKEIVVCMERFSDYGDWKSYFQEMIIPLHRVTDKHHKASADLMKKFSEGKHKRLVLTGGDDLTEYICEIFIKRLSPRLAYYLSLIDSVQYFFSIYPPKLEILVANIGVLSGIIHAYCQQKGIINYLIINGFLGDDFSDEGKYGMIINSYSESIRKNFYNNAPNVIAIGDPRMDNYQIKTAKAPSRKTVIGIGTSAFNNADLNSYSAIEFDFLNDILSVIREKNKLGSDIGIVLKVRPNGYKWQYENFIREFYPDLDVEILDFVPMKAIFDKINCYITFYSQTLFEAAASGIPSIYYRNDVLYMHAPFNGKSELITLNSREELKSTLDVFFKDHKGLNIMNKEVMEKYLGPLDGHNLERNMDLIYKLLKCNSEEEALALAGEINNLQIMNKVSNVY